MKNKQNKKIKKSIQNFDNWKIFSENYLMIAKLGVLEMMDNEHRKKWECGYTPTFTKNDLYIPVLYNIKHGIEIFIKTLKYTISGQLTKADKKHDLKYLFEILRNELKKHKIIETIKNNEEKSASNKSINDKERFNSSIASIGIDNFPKNIDEVEKKILKYYHCSFINKKLTGLFVLEDIKNELFRYPEGETKIKINYNSVISKIKESDKGELLKDIDFLLGEFNRLQFIFEVYKSSIKKIY